MAYSYDDPSGGKIAFYGQREQAPALAKARKGLQFGMTAYSPSENPAERDARARELLSGYGEALGNIQLAGTRAGQSLWEHEESLAAAEGDRTENTRRWEAEMELRRKGPGTTGGSSTEIPYNQLRLMGLQDREASPAPAGFRPDYGASMGAARYDVYDPANNPQWSKGPGTTDPNWKEKKPTDRLTSTITQAPFAQSGLKNSFMPEVGPPPPPTYINYGAGTYTPLQMASTSGMSATEAAQAHFGTSQPSPIVYGAGSEEAYKKAMGYTSSSGRTY